MLVSVIVPNFNHLKFLPKRLHSIFEQSFQDFEVILLDDCSSDGSWDYLLKFDEHFKVSHCIRNEFNSGSPFNQWKKGLSLAKGELIWIAESDDWADLAFLERCISYFHSSEISMVVASSFYVDSGDQQIGEVPLHISPGAYDGDFFAIKHMYFRNSVVNASSVVFRKSLIMENILEELEGFYLSGDHLFWSGLMKGYKVVFLEDKLNFFRWHEQSVRYQELKKLTELKEGVRIKRWLEDQFQIEKNDQLKSRRDIYLSYFKFLKINRENKSWNEFFEISSFFTPLNRIKALIRFIVL